MTKLAVAQAVANSGRVAVPGLSQSQLIYMLSCLRVDELKAVYIETVCDGKEFELKSMEVSA